MKKKVLLLPLVALLAGCNNQKQDKEKDYVLLSETTTTYFYSNGVLEDTEVEKDEYSYSNNYRQMDVKTFMGGELDSGYGFKYNKNDQEVENYFGYYYGEEFECNDDIITTYEGDHILVVNTYAGGFKDKGGSLASSMEYYWMNRVLNTISVYNHDEVGNKSLDTLYSYTYGVDFEEQKAEKYEDEEVVSTLFQKLVTKEENNLVKKSLFMKENEGDEYVLFSERHTDKNTDNAVYEKANLGGTIYERFYEYNENNDLVSVEETYDGEEDTKTVYIYNNGVIAEEKQYCFDLEAEDYTALSSTKTYTSDENGVVTKIVNTDYEDGVGCVYSETTFTYEIVNHKVTAIPDVYKPISKKHNPALDYTDADSFGFIIG